MSPHSSKHVRTHEVRLLTPGSRLIIGERIVAGGTTTLESHVVGEFDKFLLEVVVIFKLTIR